MFHIQLEDWDWLWCVWTLLDAVLCVCIKSNTTYFAVVLQIQQRQQSNLVQEILCNDWVDNKSISIVKWILGLKPHIGLISWTINAKKLWRCLAAVSNRQLLFITVDRLTHFYCCMAHISTHLMFFISRYKNGKLMSCRILMKITVE